MPVDQCEIDGALGYRWGKSGKCYTYRPGDLEGRDRARRLATAQGQAARAAGYQEDEGAERLPAYVVAALKKGLELYKDGHGGDGLQSATLQAARAGVSSGEWSTKKIITAAAWFARHEADRERMTDPRSWDKAPRYSPAYVAWLLWGSDSDDKGREWIESKADTLRDVSEKPGDASTPAPPEDRVKGGRNTGRAAGGSTAAIKLSPATNKALKAKVDAHNEKHGNSGAKRVTLAMLQKVYLRGAGAFSTSHRPGMTRAQWALGRVNAFLYLMANGKPESAAYVTDNDLLPKGHPRAAKEAKTKESAMMRTYENHGRILSALTHELDEVDYALEQKGDSAEAKAIRVMFAGAIKAVHGLERHGHRGRASLHRAIALVIDLANDVAQEGPDGMYASVARYLSELADKYEYDLAMYQKGPDHAHHDGENEGRPYEAIDDPSASQRENLPPAAYEPAAFFASADGDYENGGDFLSSRSKLPHHINTVENPNDDSTVDIPRLRNALARFGQTDWSGFPPDTKTATRAHLERHADAVLYQGEEGTCKQCAKEDLEALALDVADFRAGRYAAIASRLSSPTGAR